QTSSGTVDAATRQAAIAMLAGRQLFVTRIAERNGSATGIAKPQASEVTHGATLASSWRRVGGGVRGRVRGRALAMLWGQLATALDAGLPLLTSIRVVGEQTQ